MRALVWRLATCTPWTMTRSSPGKTRRTSPVLPLSRPLMTTTLSPFLIFSFGIFALLEDLGRQRHDLHEPARPQFPGDRTKDTGPDRLVLIGDQHSGVAVEPNGAAVDAVYLFCRAHDDRAVHIPLLDPATWDRLLHRD